MSCESRRDLRVVFRDMIAPERQRKGTCPWAGVELCAGQGGRGWKGRRDSRNAAETAGMLRGNSRMFGLQLHQHRRYGMWEEGRSIRTAGEWRRWLGSHPPTHSGAAVSAPAACLHAPAALGCPLAYTDQEKQAMLKEWAFVRGNGVSLTQHFKQQHQNTLEEDGGSFKVCGVTSPLCTLKLQMRTMSVMSQYCTETLFPAEPQY